MAIVRRLRHDSLGCTRHARQVVQYVSGRRNYGEGWLTPLIEGLPGEALRRVLHCPELSRLVACWNGSEIRLGLTAGRRTTPLTIHFKWGLPDSWRGCSFLERLLGAVLQKRIRQQHGLAIWACDQPVSRVSCPAGLNTQPKPPIGEVQETDG